jgi:murein DD-endopeptidase MepM/ murein hydrolase activator NlpD
MAVTRFASLIHNPQSRKLGRGPNPPALRDIGYQTQRLLALDRQQTQQLVAADQSISQRVAQLQTSLRRVGVDTNDVERHQYYRMGGIFLPLSSMKIDGISDPAFVEAYGGVIAHAKQLDSLFATISHVPLTTPVHGPQFEITSEFGPRIDPINHRLGFHPGLDFGGPWGAEVRATAPGTVVFAGQKGGYGNLVEIDHGFGFHTRYGHLSAILVHVGTKIAKGTPVGKLGSTGRSTGPHVHYEVFYADVVRDPSRYIEAGRHVFE